MFEKNVQNLIELEKAIHAVEIPENFAYQLPPNSFAMLHGDFLDYRPREELTTTFRIDHHFSNPQGTAQGGIISACFDDTFGPLGVVTTRKPILTVDMNVQYIRPVLLDEKIVIVAQVISVSRSTLFMQADAFNLKGKLLAKASTNQLILR